MMSRTIEWRSEKLIIRNLLGQMSGYRWRIRTSRSIFSHWIYRLVILRSMSTIMYRSSHKDQNKRFIMVLNILMFKMIDYFQQLILNG